MARYCLHCLHCYQTSERKINQNNNYSNYNYIISTTTITLIIYSLIFFNHKPSRMNCIFRFLKNEWAISLPFFFIDGIECTIVHPFKHKSHAYAFIFIIWYLIGTLKWPTVILFECDFWLKSWSLKGWQKASLSMYAWLYTESKIRLRHMRYLSAQHDFLSR